MVLNKSERKERNEKTLMVNDQGAELGNKLSVCEQLQTRCSNLIL